MSDLTLEEKLNGAETRAREKVCEKHFYDLNVGSYRCTWFSFSQRDTHHWDVTAPSVKGEASAWNEAHPGGSTSCKDGDSERAFCIRGEPGKIFVRDERWDPHRPHPRESIEFKTVQLATLWIIEELTSPRKKQES